MIRVLVALAFPLIFGGGFVWGSRRSADPELKRHRSYVKLLRKAARASRRGHDGEANLIYEGAQKVLSPPSQRSLPPSPGSQP